MEATHGPVYTIHDCRERRSLQIYERAVPQATTTFFRERTKTFFAQNGSATMTDLFREVSETLENDPSFMQQIATQKINTIEAFTVRAVGHRR